MKVDIKELEKSQVEISVEIPAEKIMHYWNPAMKEIQKIAEIDGFRKGHVPENILLSKFGDMAVLEEAARMMLDEEYPKIIASHSISPITSPEIKITKLAKDNPFSCVITVSVLPKIKLPNYAEITKKFSKSNDESVSVTDQEILDALSEVQRSYAHDTYHAQNPQDTEHSHGELPLPELNDAFAQKLGDFKDLQDLKDRVKANLQREKENKVIDKRRLEMFNAISDATEVVVPDVLIESEIDRMVAQLKYDISQFGGTYENYLAHTKKTEDDMRAEWRPEAERRAKVQLILNEIARTEKLSPSEEELQAQVLQAKSVYKDASEDQLTGYVFQTMQNQNVLAFLEK